MIDDTELLRRYADSRDEDAFAELVRRHVDLVHSAALRQVNGDAHLASDVTQMVFTDLARKARTLTAHRVLAGWLFTSTRFAASKIVRGEQRWHVREQEAQAMQELTRNSDAALDWDQVRPVLDPVLAELSDSDREAILLRFFEGRDFSTIGARLAVSDNTARMRVDRALDKLRALLERRGVTSTTAALATALAGHAVGAAPAGLAASVAGAAVAAGAGGGAAAALMSFMSLTKMQMITGGALVAAATTGFVMQAHSNATLRREIAELQQQSQAMAALRSENEQLRRTAAEVADLRQDDAELARVSDEATRLKTNLAAAAAPAAKPAGTRSLEVYDISKLDRAPRPTTQARPAYPFEMRRAGVSGEVVVDLIVDQFGKVQNAHAIRSTRPEFEAAAVAAVSQWVFVAGVKDGRNVATHMQVPIVFSLSNATKGAPPKAEPPPGY